MTNLLKKRFLARVSRPSWGEENGPRFAERKIGNQSIFANDQRRDFFLLFFSFFLNFENERRTVRYITGRLETRFAITLVRVLLNPFRLLTRCARGAPAKAAGENKKGSLALGGPARCNGAAV